MSLASGDRPHVTKGSGRCMDWKGSLAVLVRDQKPIELWLDLELWVLCPWRRPQGGPLASALSGHQ